ncbi:T9SS type B sorting domain-containing protein [uncultured Flavobacterium sp.]|uniref:T9SS type B sorting domain-containing protein n=1 Tax=uncultured Flavobacterium sp. TaxID=165435 RepID=UPI0030ECD104
MKKKHRSFLYLLLVVCLFNVTLYGYSRVDTFDSVAVLIVPPAAPAVISPIYYCLNGAAVPLKATASAGAALVWYGTSATGGSPSAVAPTPSTTAVGQTSYYVSQVDGTGESPRAVIVVNVVADNGAVILNFRCDPTQATTTTSVFFDWSNNAALGSNTYNYTYMIEGGGSGSGTTGVSHQEVFGMAPGQKATMILSSATSPCATATLTCSVPCGTSTVTPNFAQIAPFCSGDPAPVLGNTSPNGITGTWSPATVSNTASGSYLFTPNPTTFPCALTQTLAITVTPRATPTFTSIPTTVCQNAAAPVLPLNSNNTPSISGTWNPSTVNTSVLGPVTYTFTANAGQCVVATKTTATITVQANVAPNFASIGAICTGNPVPVLATTSPNGIIGTWAPAAINNTTSGSYVFTPTAGQCATQQTLPVTITPRTVPNFPAIASFCEGTAAPILDNNVASPNGVSGTWAPATISNTASGSYVFTPNANQCATNQTLNVTVNLRISPGFNSFAICSGSVPPVLQTTSPNGIKGTWSPAVVNNMNTGSYIFTPDSNQCANPETIVVTVIPSNTLTDFQWTVTEAFAENQVVTIIAIASGGKYLYQLDDGPFQESPIFEYVSSGYHTVTVIDEGGCSVPIVRTNILVIGYPKYFTPNADGYNDRWNIYELQDDVSSKIHIFDRYGKLLKEITPDGTGWDGTYNGRPMPGNDYWFVVEYRENDILKKFKSHFSLKR